MPQSALRPRGSGASLVCARCSAGLCSSRIRTIRSDVGLYIPSQTRKSRALHNAVRAAAPGADRLTEGAHFFGKTVLRVLCGGNLEETFQAMNISDAALDSFVLLTMTYISVKFGNKIIRMIENKLEKTAGSQSAKNKKNTMNPLVLLNSVRKPLDVMFPFYGVIFGLNVASTFLEVALTKIHVANAVLSSICSAAVAVVGRLCNGLEKSSEVVVVIFIGWSLLNLKDNLIERLSGVVPMNTFDEEEVFRFVQPLSQLLTWGIAAATVLSALCMVGIGCWSNAGSRICFHPGDRLCCSINCEQSGRCPQLVYQPDVHSWR